MPLTDVEVRSARPREKAYRLTDGSGMYLESLRQAESTGGSNTDLQARKSGWRWASIQM
ncbi:protein of unknown function [Paraburkholderia dioscoreae]|uniref:Integrase n=1 Tax=Paraburkholderia dioscoreae TaxID=2604047 RepID=A0A5Q4Z5M4_9BURK|nr:protein of unknown function [Paraburkholderia dioscoreae]